MGRIRIRNEYKSSNTSDTQGILDEFLRGGPVVRIPVAADADLDTEEQAYLAVYAAIRRAAKNDPVKMLRVLSRIYSYGVQSWNRQNNTVNVSITDISSRQVSQRADTFAYLNQEQGLSWVKYCENREEAIEAMTGGILATRKEITILMPYDGKTMPEYEDFQEAAYETHKPGRVNDGAYLRSHSKSGGRVTRFLCLGIYVLHYTIEYRTTHEQEQMLMAAVDEEIHRMGLDRPDAAGCDKIAKVYQYIAREVEYDYDYKRYTAYHAMIEHKAVCMGCALLFLLFMRRLNVPAEYITGLALPSEGRHAWNIVKLGRHWYNVDTTWERFCAGKRITITERKYYLKAEKDFKNHVREAPFLTREFTAAHPMAKKSL